MPVDESLYRKKPEIFEIAGQTLFPLYGCSGGLSASYISYIVAERTDGRRMKLAVEFKVCKNYSKEEIAGRVIRGMINALAVFDQRATEFKEGGDLGRGDVEVEL